MCQWNNVVQSTKNTLRAKHSSAPRPHATPLSLHCSINLITALPVKWLRFHHGGFPSRPCSTPRAAGIVILTAAMSRWRGQVFGSFHSSAGTQCTSKIRWAGLQCWIWNFRYGTCEHLERRTLLTGQARLTNAMESYMFFFFFFTRSTKTHAPNVTQCNGSDNETTSVPLYVRIRGCDGIPACDCKACWGKTETFTLLTFARPCRWCYNAIFKWNVSLRIR